MFLSSTSSPTPVTVAPTFSISSVSWMPFGRSPLMKCPITSVKDWTVGWNFSYTFSRSSSAASSGFENSHGNVHTVVMWHQVKGHHVMRWWIFFSQSFHRWVVRFQTILCSCKVSLSMTPLQLSTNWLLKVSLTDLTTPWITASGTHFPGATERIFFRSWSIEFFVASFILHAVPDYFL